MAPAPGILMWAETPRTDRPHMYKPGVVLPLKELACPRLTGHASLGECRDDPVMAEEPSAVLVSPALFHGCGDFVSCLRTGWVGGAPEGSVGEGRGVPGHQHFLVQMAVTDV